MALLLALWVLAGTCGLASPEASSEEPAPAAEGEAGLTEAPEEIPEAPEEAFESVWIEPGNTDAAIREGGWYLRGPEANYYSDRGIRRVTGAGETLLSGDDARNLNLAEGWLYYTLGERVYRIPEAGGQREEVFAFRAEIGQLYVLGRTLRFLAGGGAYTYDMDTEALTALPAPDGVRGLIPTPWGDLYLTGEPLDRTLWAGDTPLVSGVEQLRRDGDRLVLVLEGQTLQCDLADIFARRQLSPASYRDGGEGAWLDGSSEEEQLRAEAAYYASDAWAALEARLTLSLDGAEGESGVLASTAQGSGTLTLDQKNIVLRARQMGEVTWTPLEDVMSWGCDDAAYAADAPWAVTITAEDGTVSQGVFLAGKTYRGVPYAQPVYNSGYVGWNLSLDDFAAEVEDPDSRFYSERSSFTRDAPCYGSDCSAFVSWAWATERRKTIVTITQSDSVYLGRELTMLRVGDVLDDPTEHAALVTDIGYDAEGHIVAVEITEQIPGKLRTVCYGEVFPGRTYRYRGTLALLQSYYLDGGYGIYRRDMAGAVPFRAYRCVDVGEGEPLPLWDETPALIREERRMDAVRALQSAVGIAGSGPV